MMRQTTRNLCLFRTQLVSTQLIYLTPKSDLFFF